VGLDAPALIWVSFSFVIGLPMAFAGLRGWRLTTGVGVGLAGTVAGMSCFDSSNEFDVQLALIEFFIFFFCLIVL
jgi:hypothetical protein